MADRSFTLFVPGRPLLTNQERKLHRLAAAQVIREIRRSAWLLAKAKRVGLYDAVAVTARPHVHDRRPQDIDACHPTVKAAVDGLVDAGVLRNDGPAVLTALTYLPVRLSSPHGDGLELVVTAVPLASKELAHG